MPIYTLASDFETIPVSCLISFLVFTFALLSCLDLLPKRSHQSRCFGVIGFISLTNNKNKKITQWRQKVVHIIFQFDMNTTLKFLTYADFTFHQSSDLTTRFTFAVAVALRYHRCGNSTFFGHNVVHFAIVANEI